MTAEERAEQFARELDQFVEERWDLIKPDPTADYLDADDMERYSNTMPGPWVLLLSPEMLDGEGGAALVLTLSAPNQKWITTVGLCHQAIN